MKRRGEGRGVGTRGGGKRGVERTEERGKEEEEIYVGKDREVKERRKTGRLLTHR